MTANTYAEATCGCPASAAIERVRQIHQPLAAVMFAGGHQYPRQVCTGCGTDDGNWQTWPCPTIHALSEPTTTKE